MACQLYDLWYRKNCINMLSDQNTAINWNLSQMTACIIVPLCKIKVLKHWKLYKDAYILQESFATTDKSYPPLDAIIYNCFTYPWRFTRVPSVFTLHAIKDDIKLEN